MADPRTSIETSLNEEHAPVDALVRTGLEPAPETVERLVRRALRTAPRRAAPVRLRPVWALAMVLALALGLGVLRRAPEPPPTAGPSVQPVAVAAPILTISNRQGVVTITSEAGSSFVFLPGEI